jgi:Peptidase M50B-like
MKTAVKRKIGFVLGYAAFFALLWAGWDTVFVLPVKLFVVMLHEISHGIAAVLTGGSIERIELTMDQGGRCLCGGGNAFLTLSAGYLGSLLWGVLLLLTARRLGGRGRWLMAVLGAGLVVVTVLYVPAGFGLLFGLAFGTGLIVSARFLSDRGNALIVTGLGVTSCLYAILDIKSDIIDRPLLESDARMLSELTGVPTMVWGLLWIGVGLWVSWAMLRKMWREA